MVLSFPPPRNWQDFEQLTRDVANFKFSDDFAMYGRQGQSQGGIDVCGYDEENLFIGIQCKHKGHTKATENSIVTELHPDIIDKEIKLADKLIPKLDRFIMATTSFPDVHLQSYVNKLNEDRIKDKKFIVTLWTWDVFEEAINKCSDISYFYYKDILRNLKQYNKDEHILRLVKQAVDRPAFNTSFNYENSCADFINAMSDTQKAFKTGKLKDREGKRLLSSYSTKCLSLKEDIEVANKIEDILQEIRNFTTDMLKKDEIRQENSFLLIRNAKTIDTLNSKRREIILILNELLKKHNLDTIKVMY